MPESPDSQDQAIELLSRGELLLARLAKQAEAARAEAQRAELELALTAARGGSAEGLKRLLRVHEAHDADSPAPAISADVSGAQVTQLQRESAAPAYFSSAPHLSIKPQVYSDSNSRKEQDPKPGGLDASADLSWEALSVQARIRLEERADDLRRTDCRMPQILEKPKILEKTPNLRSPEEPRNQKPRAATTATASAMDAGGIPVAKPRVKPKEVLQKLAAEFQPEVLEDQQLQHRKLKLISRVGGLTASALLHVALLVILALVTLKLPMPPASLSFESNASESTIETFEVTQTLEASEPIEATEPMPMSETAVSLASDLPSMTSALTAAVSEVSVGSGVASSAALAAAAGGGASVPTNASFFGAEATGNCFCYVIDSSGSMRGGAWESARSEVLRSLGSLKANQRFYIIFFNQELDLVPEPGEKEPARSALYATRENLEHARKWIDTIKIDRGWPPTDALEHAIGLEPDAIYLLTDGVTQVDVPGFLESKNRVQDLILGEQVRVPIHAIAYYSLDGQQLMQQIAAENKGQFIYVPDPAKNR